MKINVFAILLFSSFICFSNLCFAEKAYVTDKFRISFRRGPSIENKILKFIESGQPVEIIETKDGWSRIELIEADPSGLEGWVLSRYLISRQPYEKQTERLLRENSVIQDELNKNKEKVNELQTENNELKSALENSQKDFMKLKNDYTVLTKDAKSFLELKEKYERSKMQLEAQVKEIKSLKTSKETIFIGTGAVILLMGLFIGLQIGRQGKKTSSLL